MAYRPVVLALGGRHRSIVSIITVSGIVLKNNKGEWIP